MASLFQSTLEKVFPKLAHHRKAYKGLIRNTNSYLYSTGWMESIRSDRPLDADGNQLPWMNYPVVEFLKQRLTKEMRLFEFGSGHSTAFYAARVQHVVAVESDQRWYEIVKDSLPGNAEVMLKPEDTDANYCRAIHDREERYHVVVVDGKDRVNCIKQCVPKLLDEGVFLLDDSQREEYSPGFEFAREHGFRRLDFEGLKPTGTSVDRTTVFYRDGNCLGI